MKTVNQLGAPFNQDPQLPFGGIKNETDTEDGTPMVEEVLGDTLTNIYKLLQTVGITPNQLQDKDSTGYQILDALKLLPNSLTDIQQVLSLSATTWSVNFDVDNFPNKTHFVAIATENYVAGTTYNFVGSGTVNYGFESAGFKASDLVLVVLDQAKVKAYSLTSVGSNASEVYTVMGTPLAYNDSNVMMYHDNGKLMNDSPMVYGLENIIRTNMSEGTVEILEMFVINGHVLCFCNTPSLNTYFFRQFSLNDLTVSYPVTISGATMGSTDDFLPYVYCGATDGGTVYVTNNMNTVVSDFIVSRLIYDPVLATLTFVGNGFLDNSFSKTTNTVISSNALLTLISGELNRFNVLSGTKVFVNTFSGVVGHIFSFNNSIYFSSGEVAKKWF